ncbi:MAG: hypothetical protein ACJ8C4_07420 [Gemmataceae bacterium]
MNTPAEIRYQPDAAPTLNVPLRALGYLWFTSALVIGAPQGLYRAYWSESYVNAPQFYWLGSAAINTVFGIAGICWLRARARAFCENRLKPVRSMRVFLFILAIWGVSFCISLPETLAERRQQKVVDEWHHRAESFAQQITTSEDAKAWLKSEGFYDVREGVGTSEGQNNEVEHFTMVGGHRQLKPRDMFSGPRFLDLDFIFTPDGQFKRIDPSLRRHALPWEAERAEAK